MLRLITDPEPDLQEAATTGTVETGLRQLVRGVFGLAWIIGPVAPRSVARLESATVRVELVAGSGELVLHLRNEQAAAAPVMLVVAATPLCGGTRGPGRGRAANGRRVPRRDTATARAAPHRFPRPRPGSTAPSSDYSARMNS
jgi:hypothetical protein